MHLRASERVVPVGRAVVLLVCVVCSGSEPAVLYRLDLVIGICWLIWRSAFPVSEGLCVALGILSRARCGWDSALVVVYCRAVVFCAVQWF